MYKDIETLINKGYRVVEKNVSNKHYHVFYDTTFLNLWAGAKRYMPKISQPSTSYTNIQEVIDYMEGKEKVVEELNNFYDKLRGN